MLLHYDGQACKREWKEVRNSQSGALIVNRTPPEYAGSAAGPPNVATGHAVHYKYADYSHEHLSHFPSSTVPQ